MFEEIDTQYGKESQTIQPNDNAILLSIPLLMRLMEWSKEEAQTDIDLHKAVERIIECNDGNSPLDIDCYEEIINDASGEIANENDVETAYSLGQDMANNGMDLTPQEPCDYSDIPGHMITAVKNNGYGASNSEIEAFWNGYEDDERASSTVIDLSNPDEQYCYVPEEPELDDDLESQIQQILQVSKL